MTECQSLRDQESLDAAFKPQIMPHYLSPQSPKQFKLISSNNDRTSNNFNDDELCDFKYALTPIILRTFYPEYCTDWMSCIGITGIQKVQFTCTVLKTCYGYIYIYI